MAAPQAEGVLPHARVRRIMKAEPALRAVTNEASLLVSKAAELFLESLAEQAAGGRASEVTYAAVAAVVAQTPRLDFLRDIVPAQQTAADVVAARATSAPR